MIGKKSVQVQYTVIFLISLLLIVAAFAFSLGKIRSLVLRNEATAVANQVVAFRSWVANSGMVWVDHLTPRFPDYLATKGSGKKIFYGKNPALATRELSDIANEISSRANFLVTSDDYRQEKNKPDEFEIRAIQAFKENPNLSYKEEYENNMYRFAKPIIVKKSCLKCHGKPEDAPAAVIEKYGKDKAFGYKIGDVRGIISVKLPSITAKDILPMFFHPVSIILIILVFLLNLVFARYFIVKRLVKLNKDASTISAGNLAKTLDYTDPDETSNEIDLLYHSVNSLKKSLLIAAKRIQKIKKNN